MDTNALRLDESVKPLTAAVLILTAVLLVIGAGLAVGYAFFWNAYDKNSKPVHDFKVAAAWVKSDPGSAQAHLALGWSYVGLDKLDKAIQEYRTALKLDSKNETARYNIALIEIQEKNLQAARQDLEALKNENPKYWDARATLGYLYRQLGEYKPAVQELELVNAVEPGRVDVLYQLGLTYAGMGDVKRARADYQSALELNPGDQARRQALAALPPS